MFKTTHMTSLKERTKDKPWGNDILYLPDCPRSITVASFHLMIGLFCLYAYLCQFRIVDSPACLLCCSGTVMNVDHLPVCSALMKDCIFSQYWKTRDSLNNLTS
ncbi:hypothetical protein NPIL_686001 [Nephila pilipes]|uniref:Uncharacterized protein n=1 Tax=Nephila pilipes TaxID=299642 RepID=A0A8X6QRD2_NEPPI|nr:hypothetical protein NPIL_686001 [Nephila pilipes]